MPLPPTCQLQLSDDLTICRILNGMWQVSGAHGSIRPEKAIPAMFRCVDAGFTTWDLADHYGPAEDLNGEFRRQFAQQRGADSLAHLQAFTKWVPRPGAMTRQVVEGNIDISRQRMGMDTLDLLQFHWWDYGDRRYLDALKHLVDLKTEGKIRHVALTNFDTERLQAILENGIPILSNQVQFSLIDQRPLVRMAEFCQQQGIHLLAYGTVCGGLLSERYLGQPEPQGRQLDTVSLRKYKQMVGVWGGWSLFQDLLQVLDGIAKKHGVSIANVAVRSVLDRPAVAGAIVGARLGITEHIADNARVFDLALDNGDLEAMARVMGQSRNLFALIGDCGDEYRG
jgi:aryl-alcohol dehydrogenase-like predicted oxidoreductase